MSDVPPTGGQHGWQAPPPPPPPGGPPSGWNPPPAGPARRPGNGAGVAALVLGILALFASWIPIFGLVLPVLAVIFGVVGMRKVRRGEATNREMALAGVILGAIALVISLLATLIGAAVLFKTDEVRDFTDCLAEADTDADRANCEELFQRDLGR